VEIFGAFEVDNSEGGDQLRKARMRSDLRGEHRSIFKPNGCLQHKDMNYFGMMDKLM